LHFTKLLSFDHVFFFSLPLSEEKKSQYINGTWNNLSLVGLVVIAIAGVIILCLSLWILKKMWVYSK